MVHKEKRKRTEAVSPVIGVILMVAITVILAAVIGTFVLGLGSNLSETPSAGISADQSPGEVKLTIIDGGNLEGAQLVAPSGTKSSVLSEGLETGSVITLRSNASLVTFLGEDNVTIPGFGGGTTKINDAGDVPSTALQRSLAPPKGSNYNKSTAYLACLFDHGGFEVDGTKITSNLSIPCHAPILAQTPSVIAGSSIENAGITKTRPIILQSGTYQLIGRVGGDEGVIQTIEVSESVAQT